MIPFIDFWNAHPWARLGATIVVALLFGALLHRLVYLVLRRLTRGHEVAADMLHRASAPMGWLVPLAALTVALRVSPMVPGVIQHVLLASLIGTATWLGVSSIGALESWMVREFPLDTTDNLRARRVQTQARVLGRAGAVILVLVGAALTLMTIPGVRQIGTSLLASAGVAGLALGFAAKPVLGNLIAGLQIALAQPIRLDDVVIIEGEWGRIEEITGTYVVVRIWDERRLVVPLNYFIEHPFQNWTRTTSKLIGSVFLWLDYRMPLEPLRAELQRLCKQAPQWDGRVCVLQVTDANERAMQLRVLVSTVDSGTGWDLRCFVREGLIAFVQANYPHCLPLRRTELHQGDTATSSSDRSRALLSQPADGPSPGSP